jgi:hypothetical protein
MVASFTGVQSPLNFLRDLSVISVQVETGGIYQALQGGVAEEQHPLQKLLLQAADGTVSKILCRGCFYSETAFQVVFSLARRASVGFLRRPRITAAKL